MDCQGDFISGRYLPDGVQVKDPSKLQTTEATALLEFWYDRQENGVPPVFQFKGWKNGRGELVDPVQADRSRARGQRTSRSMATARQSSSESLEVNARRPRAVARRRQAIPPSDVEEPDSGADIEHRTKTPPPPTHHAVVPRTQITPAAELTSMPGEDNQVEGQGGKRAGRKRRAVEGQLISPRATKQSRTTRSKTVVEETEVLLGRVTRSRRGKGSLLV
jgi:hypothetical protein